MQNVYRIWSNPSRQGSALQTPPAGRVVMQGSWLPFGKANPESLTTRLDGTLNLEVHKRNPNCFVLF